MRDAYGQVRIGDPLESGTLMGPLIDAAAVQRYEAAVATAVASGGRLVTGGRRLDRPGFFVEPAIVVASHDAEIVRTETFGPVLYLIPYSDLDAAIQMQRGRARVTTSAIFWTGCRWRSASCPPRARTAVSPTSTSAPPGAEIGGAFGGEKDTGGGRESGSDAQAYMRRQTAVNWSHELPLAQGINFDLTA